MSTPEYHLTNQTLKPTKGKAPSIYRLIPFQPMPSYPIPIPLIPSPALILISRRYMYSMTKCVPKKQNMRTVKEGSFVLMGNSKNFM